MKKQYFLAAIFVLLYAFSFSQEGNIKGTISDEQGLVVPYATISIPDLNKGTVSDSEGKFLLLKVPIGNQTLKIEYLGYGSQELSVEVKEGETVEVKIVLKPQVEELDGVILTGFASGQAKALNTQKNKQNITNIVSSDQVGKFPDANIGDAVKRIPGITMQVDQGEARNVIVRGLAPQLNSVTLNGSRIPSAEGDNRNIQMDLIPADMIQQIEVNKAVTPDMDGDALGGSVNLVTRTAPEGFRVSATAGSGVSFITDKRILNGSFLVGDRSKDGKFGWMLSASINDNDFGSDNIEFEWVNEAESPVTDEDIEVSPFVEEHDIRTYLVQRVRRSFSANFDYNFNANNSIFLKTMYNWRDDRENRYRLRFRSIEPIFEDGTENINGYQGEIRRQTKGGLDNNRNQNRRLEDQRMQNYSLGGNHLFGTVKMDWMASYANASEERLNERYIEYELEENDSGDPIPFNVNLSNPEFPVITAVNSNDVTLDRFELNEITEENQFTEEKDFNIFANFELPADFFDKGDGFVKFGGRLKIKDKNRDNNFFEFSPQTSDFDNFNALPLTSQTDSDFLAGSQYAAGQYVAPEFLGQLNLSNASQFESESVVDEFLAGNFEVSENVFAGYVMANQKLSDKLTVLAGLRLESTKTETQGNEVIFDEDGDFDSVNVIKEDNTYTNILPGLHFKYDLNDRTIIRFAWTNTLARPNYIDLVPFRNVVNEDEELVLGNPNLDATTSMNFDLMAEHYFKNVGIISGGTFYKSINDFIYVFQFEDAASGFDAFQPRNGDSANIFGFELAFQRQLDFLPGFAKNFNIYLNYTYLNSTADGVRNEDGDERTDLDLPGTAPNMFNGSLAYTDKKFNIRLSANYSDAYIDEIGGSAFEDRYYDEQFLLDFNVSYAINPNLRIYADLNNITDQPLRYFQGVSNRTMQAEYYGRRLTFGLKYDLFKRK
ncbi:TonB-dependent receptor [Ichthyenterobacterium sp. W332]|uniref:TonB-dependent receptor n=1 Tax=Microcosmobacter mediterraneus TaxID=3075607 RepID=A0ABU2YLU0_9FLAO|nr:TonB-dependent receptor [Ichthyenterobacterium sp. W332]MDT0558235.1 TonB-dependent receptor [Ichthyenterobacterium sp. W332]